MTKFDWIKSEVEFQKVCNYVDGMIKSIRLIPESQGTLEMYIRHVNDYDTLLDLGIQKGWNLA